jgi:cysteine desulfurase
MLKLPLYLDYHATTPVDPRALEAMLPYFTERFGNASSRTHRYGWEAGKAVEAARAQVAGLIGADPREIVFTSGATEANNLAIRGVMAAARDRGSHAITSVIEHKAVSDPFRRLEGEGCRVTRLGVGSDGRIRLDDLRAAITPETVLVSIMGANNEIGVVQPLVEIGAVAGSHNLIFHADIAQVAGRIPFDVNESGVHLASFSAHKLYGPKGVGALFARRRLPLVPVLDGGGQERGLRPGTLNVPGIVGFGRAAEICREEMAAEGERLRRLRDRLLEGLRAVVRGLHVNGSLEHRLPNNLHVSLEGVDGEALLMALGDLGVSTGAACTSAGSAPSLVLEAIGCDEALARASIRFGLGRFTTAEEVEFAIEKMATVARRLREMRSEAGAPAPAGRLEAGAAGAVDW